MVVKPKDEKELKERIEKDELVVIDFKAEWCGTCNMYQPIFEEASKQSKKITFIAVDVDTFSDFVSNWDVGSIPTTVFLKNGKEVLREVGFVSEDDLKSKIKNLEDGNL